MSFIDLRSQELHENILVYKNLLPDSRFLYNSICTIEQQNKGEFLYGPWKKWYDFGTYSEQRLGCGENVNFTNYKFEEEFYLSGRLAQATNLAIANYVTIHKMDLPSDSFITTPSLAKYDGKTSTSDGLIMQYHTDFGIGEWYWPGDKFLITCTTYLNDDYEGGEIEFYVNGEKITYKPSAGDILVFPSGSPIYPGNEPYFHGVRTISNGEKYLVRNYLKYPFEGTEEWREGEKRFGTEEWKEICLKKDKYQNTLSFDEQGNPHMSDVAVKIYKKNSKWISK
jgi:hypothetical protein